MKQQERVRYYHEYTDDFVESKEQNKRLPEDYEFVRDGFWARIRSALTYTAAILFGIPFCFLFLRTRYVNRKAFKKAKSEGAFIYGNHTQPVGDVVLPALACLPRRIYTIVSPANLGIPFIGRHLPYLGALPIPDTVKGMRSFGSAIDHRIEQKKIITVYPEAHVWEYCTMIRPYSEASFKYPVKLNKPVFSMTVTYQKPRFGKRPRTTVYIDGPFYPDRALKTRQQAADLRDRVYARMCQRSKHSDYDYIRYEKYSEDAE